MSNGGLSLETRPIHLGLGATAEPQPEFPRDETTMQWYADYASRHEADGFDARLVASYTFTESWPMWEMHPNGAEVVICAAGSMTLHQDLADGTSKAVTLEPGQYAINPPGAWHTADIHGEASAIFITAGVGTRHRAR
jgi:quercetin dioxygenase-like cupin family protein